MPAEGMIFCYGCGKEIHSSAPSCPHCGALQKTSPSQTADGDWPQLQAPHSGGFNWYLDVLKKYAVFSGRARRKEYWMFALFNFLILLLIGFILGLLGAPAAMGDGVSAIYNLAILVPAIAVGVRRMHDTGRSGWWLLLPIANLVFLCQGSQPDTNQYGPVPRIA